MHEISTILKRDGVVKKDKGREGNDLAALSFRLLASAFSASLTPTFTISFFFLLLSRSSTSRAQRKINLWDH